MGRFFLVFLILALPLMLIGCEGSSKKPEARSGDKQGARDDSSKDRSTYRGDKDTQTHPRGTPVSTDSELGREDSSVTSSNQGGSIPPGTQTTSTTSNEASPLEISLSDGSKLKVTWKGLEDGAPAPNLMPKNI